jgi:type II secretory pathway component GspD/PulD (secretin)
MPLVSVVFEKRPLTEALKELSTLTDVSIVVDSRAGEKEGNTATFKNVPLDTAVRVLADIAGLSSVLIDNVLYVTTRPNAKALEAEQAKRRGE